MSGGTSLAPGLKVAETVYDSFGTLLGLKDMQQVAAALIGNALTDKGSGYLLIANTSPQGVDMRQMRVVNGRLCWPKSSPEDGASVYEFDHMLLALERLDRRRQKRPSARAVREALVGDSGSDWNRQERGCKRRV